MRGLLRDYAADGGTVLLSSHLLHEVEQIAEDLVVIGHGRIVAQGTKDELLRSGGTVVDSPDLDGLATALRRAGHEVAPCPEAGVLTSATAEDVARLACVERLLVTELRAATTGGLEEMFLRLTADNARERVGAGAAA